MAGFMDSGVSTNIATTIAGAIFNSHTSPAGTNAYWNYDGTNLVGNVPTGKGFALSVNGANEVTVSNAGLVTADASGNPATFGTKAGSSGFGPHFGRDSGAGVNGLFLPASAQIQGTVADGASAIGIIIGTRNTLSTSGAKLLSVQNNGTEKLAVTKEGGLEFNSTNASGAPTLGIGYDSGSNTLLANTPSGKRYQWEVNGVPFATVVAVQANLTNHDGQLDVSHIAGGSGAPTSPTGGTGAGTGPTITNTGSDLAGKINVTTGSAPAGSNATIVTITWAHAYNTAPIVILTPANSVTAALSGATQVFATPGTTTLVITSGSSALAATTAYSWFYQAIQ